jgi:TolB protein
VFTRSADGALFVIGSDGSGSQQVTTRPAYRVDWSSRNRILFHRGRDIYSIRPSGRGLRRLTRTRASASARFASWSPDGRRIAFVLHPPAGFEEQPSPLIYIMRADGSLKRRLAPNGLFPTWAPDGKRIAFVRDDSLYAIRPDGTALRRVRHFRGLVRELAWQPRP